MKIFLDTGSVDEIKKALDTGVLDGVTTNPSHIAKVGGNFENTIREIGELFNMYNKPEDSTVSAEVVTLTASEMVEEAKRLAKFHPRVIVKIPMTVEGIKAVTQLSGLGIRTNVTLCFSPTQALLAAKAGATYISPFIGRLDDLNQDGLGLVAEIRTIYDNYDFKTLVLAASIRTARQVGEVALLGADIVTIPYAIYEQLYKHPLTDIGLKKFLDDWEKFQATKGK